MSTVNTLTPRARPLAIASLALLSIGLTPATARGQAAGGESIPHGESEAEQRTPSDIPEDGSKKPLSKRIEGSTFRFDQSMTTQTAQLEPSPELSYVPLYEWWFSLRPKYWFDDHFSAWARLDLYKELTNNQATTDLHEDVFGDIWTGGGWTTKLGPHKRTKVDAGVRALWPTSKASQGSGIYVTTGVSGGVTQAIPIRPKPLLSEAHVGLGLLYLHPFSRATTPVSYGNFGYVRQDVDSQSFVSDQLRGSTLVNHRLIASFDSGLEITPKLSLSLDMIFINEWHYAPTGNVTVQPQNAPPVPVGSNPDATTFTQSTWFLTSVDYSLFDEVSLGLGYYNLANVLAPDGHQRGIFGGDNVWWSPDARVFFDVTVNLDAIWHDVGERGEATKKAAREARVRHIAGNGAEAP